MGHANGDRSPVAVPDAPVPGALVRSSFYLFVFSLPFEYPGRAIPLEVHTVTASVFLAMALFEPAACFRRIPGALGCLFVFVIWYTISGVLSVHGDEVVRLSLLLIQVTLLFWSGYNVMRHEDIATTALVTFVFGCLTLSILQSCGIDFMSQDSALESDRYAALGQNPNILAANLALALLAVVGLAHGREQKVLRSQLLFATLVALLGFGLGRTGSRGALLALLAGLAAFAAKRRPGRPWYTNLLLPAVAIGLSCLAAWQSYAMSSRIERTLQGGDMAMREQIFPIAWQMFLERPLIGWGPVDNMYELGARLTEESRAFRDTHNLVLDVLTDTGLLGAIPFYLCLGLCVREGFKARAQAQGITPLALSIAVLVINLSANWFVVKQGWLVMAYALASGSPVSRVELNRGCAGSPRSQTERDRRPGRAE